MLERREYLKACFSVGTWGECIGCVTRPLILFCATVLEYAGQISPHVIILCPRSHVLRLEVSVVECCTKKSGPSVVSAVFGSWCHVMSSAVMSAAMLNTPLLTFGVILVIRGNSSFVLTACRCHQLCKYSFYIKGMVFGFLHFQCPEYGHLCFIYHRASLIFYK